MIAIIYDEKGLPSNCKDAWDSVISDENGNIVIHWNSTPDALGNIPEAPIVYFSSESKPEIIFESEKGEE